MCAKLQHTPLGEVGILNRSDEIFEVLRGKVFIL